MTTDLIRLAAQRWRDFDDQSSQKSPQLTKETIAEIVGQPIADLQLWKTNWRNRLYRFRLEDGTVAVAKQACVGSLQELETEYRSLVRMRQLRVDRLRTPKPRGFSADHRVYAMDLCQGRPLDRLLRDKTIDTSHVLDLAGIVLSEVHQQWTVDWIPFPADELMADFLAVPWRMPRDKWARLAGRIDELRGERIPVGQPYLDFKLSNILYDGDQLALIDPPEVNCRHGLLAWDVAVFRQSLFTEFAAPLHRLHADAATRFQRAYLQSTSSGQQGRGLTTRLISLLELQRICQLIALQHGRISRLRRSSSALEITPWVTCLKARATALWLRHRASQSLLGESRVAGTLRVP